MGDQFPVVGVDQQTFIPLIDNIVGCAEELLAIRLIGSPDGFRQYHGMPINLNQGYMDGVSITYGEPRQHIWSYVAGPYETHSAVSNCSCSPAPGIAVMPEFISSNYYCESGYPNGSFPVPLEIFKNDPLWDGEQCEGTCYSGTKSPWFSVQLPPTQLIGLR